MKVFFFLAIAFTMLVAFPDFTSPARAGKAKPDFGPQTALLYLPLADGETLEFTLEQLMAAFHVPGLSVAIVDRYKVVWARGFGVTAPAGKKPVITTTLFQAGSISKPVAAAGALWLVEHGKLSLDEDVNEKLKSWKVPENEFTKDQKVTLRRLMSHTAGLTVHGFPGYAASEPLPTLAQILDGEKPANTPPVRVDFVPGSRMRYSGGGVEIEQQLMMDVTGKPFPQFMQETVFRKIGMHDSTYQQPLPADRAAQAATGTRENGEAVEGKWHVYPEMAAAGLWTTPTDLAKFGIEIALSKQGKANHVLSEKMTREMLTVQTPRSPKDEGVAGLGFFLDPSKPEWFEHGGIDEGFQAELMMFADTGKGLALMGNSLGTFRLLPYLLDWIVEDYGWNVGRPPTDAFSPMLLIEGARGVDAALGFYGRVKKGEVPRYRATEDGNGFGTLTDFGYSLLESKKIDEAVKTFELDVRESPDAWNAHDSLGDAYQAAGKTDLAIESYEKSLALNPQNKHAAEMSKKLKGQ
ncbi:MAG: serine hydrolase [Myxococcales bacterium]